MTTPADDIIGLYERHAAAWAIQRARQRQPIMEAAWLDRFLDLLPPRPTILDIGCGTGEPIARYLAGKGCDITGVDAAPTIITLCEERLPGHRWHVGDMRRLQLGRTFEGLLAWDSFFHLTHDDQRRMVPVFGTHAAAGTALMFTSGPAHGEVIGAFEGEALYHASLDADDYRALLDMNGFDVVAHSIEDPACGRHTIWLARRRS